jgi:hypothetical protein
MNYALMGNIEDALVEARKVNHKLHLYITEAKRKYSESAFARYLSGILYEIDQSWGDAYIDYKKTLELRPENKSVGKHLWRMAVLSGNDQELVEIEKKYSIQPEEKKSLLSKDKTHGEIIVFYENGISPIKKPNPSFHSIPQFFPRFNPMRFARVDVKSDLASFSFKTELFDDIESMAILNLDEKYASIITKKAVGLAAKASLAYAVGSATKDSALGFLAFQVLNAADSADVRSWRLLPHDLQIGRFWLPPGDYVLKLTPVGNYEKESFKEKRIHVTAGKKQFVNFRFIP